MSTVTSPLHRFRARRRRWALLALPALLLRALVPVGFMPVASAEGLSVEMCPDAAPLPPGYHHHHHHPGGGAPDGSFAAHHTPCLFAASATLAAAPEGAALLAPREAEFSPTGADLEARDFVPSIVRAQSPRAPPVLAH
jgi:hypothetical protein